MKLAGGWHAINGATSTSFGICATLRILQDILWSPVCMIVLGDTTSVSSGGVESESTHGFQAGTT